MTRIQTRCRLGVLLSGRGSNFAAIADAIETGMLDHAEIAVVLSNKPDAGGLMLAGEKNIPTRIVKNDWEILDSLYQHNADLVILAGYNRIISVGLIQAYPNRILNIHPSLLPAYGGKGMVGMRVHRAVVDACEAESGCTVHVVIEDIDAGPVLGQARVRVSPGDTPEILAEKVLKEEHRLYPAVIGRYIAENFSEQFKPLSGQEALCFDTV